MRGLAAGPCRLACLGCTVAAEELRELVAEESAARLLGHEVAVLLRELACTAYPHGRTQPKTMMIPAVLAALLVRDLRPSARSSTAPTSARPRR